MRNTFVVTALSLSLSLMSASAMAAQFTDNGAITITGEIVDNTCILSDKSRDLLVELPVVTSSEFSAVGDYAGEKAFEILLEKCPKGVSNATVTFDGQRAEGSQDLFKASGQGSGVGFAIFDPRDTAAPLVLGKASKGYPLKGDSNQLNFIARYRATVVSAEINPGFVKGGGKFIVTYY